MYLLPCAALLAFILSQKETKYNLYRLERGSNPDLNQPTRNVKYGAKVGTQVVDGFTAFGDDSQ